MLIIFAIGIGLTAWPSGLAAFRPGPARPIEPMIEIPADRRAQPAPAGGFYLTSVYVDERVSLLAAAVMRITGRATLEPLETVRPPDIPEEEIHRLNVEMLRESELAAKAVALRAAGYEVTLRGRGVQVVAVDPDGASAGLLRPTDLIVGIDGHPVETVPELVPRIRSRPPGSPVTLAVRRSNEGDPAPVEVAFTTRPAPGAPGESVIGIAARTDELIYDPPFPIEFTVENLGGGSAGLMFALAIYDQITPGDLTHGFKIAGTGTLTPEGAVGPIGGIREKVRSAEDVGAAYFLTPVEHAAEARAVAAKIQILPVTTFDEARRALESLP